jgi:YfiH family protein
VRPRVLVTTRTGGRSSPPYAANNLALHVGDDSAVVRANRARLAGQLAVERVTFMSQVHGAGVGTVGADATGEMADVDALVTALPGCAIAVLVADCVPIAVTGNSAVAVVHAGRRGLVAGVVPAAVEALRALDAGPLVATIGPAICGLCYEVPEAMQREVAEVAPPTRSTTRDGTPGLDLAAGVRAQLLGAGVEVPDQPGVCTREDPRFYSYRRDGVTGRFAMVAMLAP